MKTPAIGYKGTKDREFLFQKEHANTSSPHPSLGAKTSHPYAPEFSFSTHSTKYSPTDWFVNLAYSITQKALSWRISIFSSLVCKEKLHVDHSEILFRHMKITITNPFKSFFFPPYKTQENYLNVFIPSEAITFNVQELLQNLIKEGFLHFSFFMERYLDFSCIFGKGSSLCWFDHLLNGHQIRQCLLQLKFCNWIAQFKCATGFGWRGFSRRQGKKPSQSRTA